MNTPKQHMMWALPLFAILLITPFISDVDLWVAKMAFYGTDAHRSHPGFFSTPFFDYVYLYGVIPSQILCALATIMLLLSPWIPAFKQMRKACLCLSLTLGFGSGLITHFALKEFWGRPRPRQIVEFGGSQSFRPYWQPLFKNTPEPSRSFPSGHSTCGFYFFSLYFLARRYGRKQLARSAIAFSLFLGGVLSLARIVQGGHFISDVLIAALIMWETAYWADYLIFEGSTKKEPHAV